MIRKIVLENYMAHARTVIEPARGLTVLIGPNNCGKSAIIHALEMICYNSDAADYAIRHGAKKAVVTVETEEPDGTTHIIQWWRKRDTAGYTIDGREIFGMGRGKTPDDLHQYLKMPAIESAAGNKEFLLHFGLQKSPIFLVGDPPAHAAQFFASATDADRLMQMQKAHQQNTTNAKRDNDRLDKEVDRLDRQLQSLQPLPGLGERVQKLEEAHGELSCLGTATLAMGKSVGEMSRFARDAAVNAAMGAALAKLAKPPELPPAEPLRRTAEQIAGAIRRIARERGRSRALASLSEVPEMQDVPAIRSAIGQIEGAQLQAATCTARIARLANLPDPPVLPDTRQLAESIKKLRRGQASVSRQKDREMALASLPPTPVLADTHELRQRLRSMADCARTCRRTSGKVAALSRLAAPAAPAVLLPLQQAIRAIAEAARAATEAEKVVARTAAALDQFGQQLAEWVEHHPRCNECGQAISVELITAGVHSHV